MKIIMKSYILLMIMKLLILSNCAMKKKSQEKVINNTKVQSKKFPNLQNITLQFNPNFQNNTLQLNTDSSNNLVEKKLNNTEKIIINEKNNTEFIKEIFIENNFLNISKASLTIFLSGLFDKSFFITTFMAMKHSKWIVMISATFSLTSIGIIAVYLGVTINQYVSVIWIDSLSVFLFLSFGVHMIYEGIYMKEEDKTENKILKNPSLEKYNEEKITLIKDGLNYTETEIKKCENLSGNNNCYIKADNIIDFNENRYNSCYVHTKDHADLKKDNFDKSKIFNINENSQASTTCICQTKDVSNHQIYQTNSLGNENIFYSEKQPQPSDLLNKYSHLNFINCGNHQENKNNNLNCNEIFNKENNFINEEANLQIYDKSFYPSNNNSSLYNSFQTKFCTSSIQSFSKVFFLIFFSEIGDRSQISTIYLTTNYEKFSVIIAVIISSLVLTILAIFGGKLLANRISEKKLTVFAGWIFVLFGFIAFYLLIQPENISESVVINLKK